MSKSSSPNNDFSGVIKLDIRDSTPDWTPYAEPKAPAQAPNVLYIVLDDTGFGAWEMFGGKIKMPNFKRIVDRGLVYTNFHTTALCSPTRSSLLNGRNATSNGMSCIEEATSGFPGSNGRIPFENAFLPATLNQQGYSTFALGKWHLCPEEEANLAANKRNWPLGRGFERYYGFLGGETDQWYPDLVYDNHLIEPPYKPDMEDPEGGYHLSKDLADKGISFIQDLKAIAPDKPWMMYFCPGANHAPHQIWPQKILDYKYNTTLKYEEGSANSFEHFSVFKEGYEQYREDVFATMKTLGIFDELVNGPAEINPHGEGELGNPDYDPNNNDIQCVPDGKEWPATEWVKPWDSLSGKEKALFVRMAEIYAAFSTYTDEQVGRLLDYLEETGQIDNTIIVAVADNGASGEGGPNGSVNENLFFNDIEDDIDKNMALIDDLGTLKTYNHYPSGWAWGFDTPFKYWKRWSNYEGGDATPFMICGPGITKDAGDSGFRKQYIHAVDLVPTIYEMIEGIEPPDVVNGYVQNPIEGVSFKYTFNAELDKPEYQYPYTLAGGENPLIPDEVKDTQFYSMLGTRGIWHKGWFACAVHAPTPSDWSNFDKDTWELYCMDGPAAIPQIDGLSLAADPIQQTNLVSEAFLTANPDHKSALLVKLEEMKLLWFKQAEELHGMPLDDRSTSAVLGEERPQLREPPFEDGDADTAIYTYEYFPGGSEIPEAVAPNVRTRSYTIEASIYKPAEAPATKDTKKNKKPIRTFLSQEQQPNGVLFSHGGRFGGHSLYVEAPAVGSTTAKLHYVYQWIGRGEQKASCEFDTANISSDPDNPTKLRVEFDKIETLDSTAANNDFGSSTKGLIKLFVDGTEQNITWDNPFDDDSFLNLNTNEFITQPGKFSLCGEGMNIGRDNGQPVTEDYETPAEFEGAIIKNVAVTIQNDAAETNAEKEFAGMLWRD